MIEVFEKPTDGTQFIAAWTYQGNLWSGNYRYCNDAEDFQEYKDEDESWGRAGFPIDESSIKYFVAN